MGRFDWRGVGQSIRLLFGRQLLFAIYHMNLLAISRDPLILGLVFAWWIIQTGSLLPCLLGHALNNFLAIYIVTVVKYRDFVESPDALIFHIPWWV